MTLDPAALQFFQLVAYVTLTLGTLAVTAITGFNLYRQNRGWKPMVFEVTRAPANA
jgi:hypothetical protein